MAEHPEAPPLPPLQSPPARAVQAAVFGVTEGMAGVGTEEGLGREAGRLAVTCVQELLELLVQPTADPLLSSLTDHKAEGLLHAVPLLMPLASLQWGALDQS